MTLGTLTETTLKIGDDDNVDVTVQFSQGALSVAERATQQVTDKNFVDECCTSMSFRGQSLTRLSHISARFIVVTINPCPFPPGQVVQPVIAARPIVEMARSVAVISQASTLHTLYRMPLQGGYI